MRLVSLTFDLDLVNHITGEPAIDELTDAVPPLLDVLEARQCPATWFIRLDSHVRAMHGDPEFVFRCHGALVDRLLERGDEIGWHPHSYLFNGGVWEQNRDSTAVVAELGAHAPMARARGLRSVRMGWGFHTNQTMRFLANAGFSVDSSAIPRPAYPWDRGSRDWTITPLTPYRPSSADYRVPGDSPLPLVEVPLSVVHVPARGDTQTIMRYVNPAFDPEALADPLRSWFAAHDVLVTVTHPYELRRGCGSHPLLAGSLDAFRRNLDAIAREASSDGEPASFVTLSALAERLE